MKITGVNFAQTPNRPHCRELVGMEQERLEKNHTSLFEFSAKKQ